MATDPRGYGQYRGGFAPGPGHAFGHAFGRAPGRAATPHPDPEAGGQPRDAEADLWDDDDAAAPPSRGNALRRGAQRAVNSAGALTSLALIVGLGVWGYRLAVRDVTGVPVIAALEGPARVAPDDPGGDLAQHTGLAVNTVTALGEAAGTADELQLAPRATALTDEDLPMAELGAVTPAPRHDLAPVEEVPPLAAARGVPPEPLPDEAPEPILEPMLDLPEVADTDAAVALALGEAPAAPEAPSGAFAGERVPASVPGVARSPRPAARPRPTGTMALAAADAAAEAALPSYRDIDPATLGPGTRLVQLGAFDDEAQARDEWNRIALDFGPLMAGKGRVIQPAESAGRVFYRLRATGFADLAEARRFCAALVGKDLHCIPVQVR